MSVEFDSSSAKFAEYAHPERLVTTDWLAEHLGEPGPRRRRVRRGRAALRDRPHPRRRQDRLAHRPQRPGRARLRRRRAASPRCSARKGISRDDDRRDLRRQEQLVGGLRPLGVLAVRPRGRAPARRRPRQVDRRGPRRSRPTPPTPAPIEYPVVERDDTRAPRLQGGRARPPRQPAHRRPLPRGVRRRAHHGARLPRGGRAARRPHPDRRRACRGRGPSPTDGTFKPRAELDAIYRDEAGLQDGDDVDRLLPHRRAVEPHLVRAHAPARLRERPQLRRLVDRVGQRRARPDRHGCRAAARSPAADRHRRAVSHAAWENGTDGRHDPARPLAEIRDDFLALERAIGCSCCSSSRTSCPSCPSTTTTTPTCSSGSRSASRRCSSSSRSTTTASCTCTRPRRAEAPTTRGFASHPRAGPHGPDGRRGARVPADYPQTLGLTEAVSPLRIARHDGHARPREAPGARAHRRLRRQLSPRSRPRRRGGARRPRSARASRARGAVQRSGS